MKKESASVPSSRAPRLPDTPDLAGIAPRIRHLAAGETLFRQGDASFGLFRLGAGQLRLFRATSGGTEVAMHTVRAGELFAEASLFSSHYHCHAVALKASMVLIYPKQDLVSQFMAHPDAMWQLASELAHRVQGLRTRLEVKQIRSASMRVLQALRLYCDASGCWQPAGTLRQFADEIGLTHEALYRALAKLERERRIERKGKQLRLIRDDSDQR